MNKYFDTKRDRLLFIRTSANKNFWDEQWSSLVKQRSGKESNLKKNKENSLFQQKYGSRYNEKIFGKKINDVICSFHNKNYFTKIVIE